MQTVRLYDVKENRLCYKYDHEAPVLDCCFGGDNASSAYSAGVDQSVKMVNLETGVQRTLGGHNKAIKCVEYSNTSQLCVTGSWDCAVKLWDHRAANALIGQVYQQGKKVYTMALTSTRVVVGTSDRQVFIYDIRKIAQPEQVRESSLVNQTRCIRTFPDENGYALSSIEGRVAIEYFDVSPEAQRLKYAFKCHRSTVGNKTTLYPVNSIAFHPMYVHELACLRMHAAFTIASFSLICL